MDGIDPVVLSLAAALGCGLLIGAERERRKGQGAAREPAGIRTFAIAALGGALAVLTGVSTPETKCIGTPE